MINFERDISISFLFLFFCNMICLAQINTTTLDSPTIPVVKNSSIKKIKLAEGVFDQKFVLTNNQHWDVAVAVPKIEKDKKVPLILALHWAGGGNTYKEYSNCLAFPSLEPLNGIIIAPSAEGKHWVDKSMEIRVIKLIKKLIKYWPINPEKVIVTGYSNGGIGSWYYAKKYPKLFAASLPIAGSYTADNIKVPLYVLHGGNDELFNPTKVEKALTNSIKQGSKITYKIIDNLTHYSACSYTVEAKLMIHKMNTEVLNNHEKNNNLEESYF